MTMTSLRTLTLMLAGSLTLACGGDDGESATDASTGGATEPATTGGHSSTSSATDVATTDGSDATTNIATTDGSDATTNIATTDGSDATSEVSSTGGTGELDPDPDHVRECQKEDFVCSDWGCENLPHVKLSQCYKRCTPDEIGGPDAECDEPERPFCSQVGQAFGGDFDCNGCAHICVSAAINQCDQDIASCE